LNLAKLAPWTTPGLYVVKAWPDNPGPNGSLLTNKFVKIIRNDGSTIKCL